MNARYKHELKPLRGDLCPICKTERLDRECEVDAAKCLCCMQEEADFVHSRHELRGVVAHV